MTQIQSCLVKKAVSLDVILQALSEKFEMYFSVS